MRPVLYTAMAVWMLVAATLRIGLQVADHYRIDVLPFMGLALAIVALVLQAVTRRASAGVHIALGVWLIIGSAARVALQLTGQQPLDPIPFISAALGIAGLVVILTRSEKTVPVAER